MTIPPGNTYEPLHELKHDAVPGYPKAFAIAFAAMALYLLLILLTSPGPAEGHHGHTDSSHETESAH